MSLIHKYTCYILCLNIAKHNIIQYKLSLILIKPATFEIATEKKIVVTTLYPNLSYLATKNYILA